MIGSASSVNHSVTCECEEGQSEGQSGNLGKHLVARGLFFGERQHVFPGLYCAVLERTDGGFFELERLETALGAGFVQMSLQALPTRVVSCIEAGVPLWKVLRGCSLVEATDVSWAVGPAFIFGVPVHQAHHLTLQIELGELVLTVNRETLDAFVEKVFMDVDGVNPISLTILVLQNPWGNPKPAARAAAQLAEGALAGLILAFPTWLRFLFFITDDEKEGTCLESGL